MSRRMIETEAQRLLKLERRLSHLEAVVDRTQGGAVSRLRTSGGTIISGTLITVTWETLGNNDGGGFLDFSGTTTCEVLRAGWVEISAGVRFAGNATGRRQMEFNVGGSPIASATWRLSTVGATDSTILGHAITRLNGGALVTVTALQTSGAALALSGGRVSVRWLRP